MRESLSIEEREVNQKPTQRPLARATRRTPKSAANCIFHIWLLLVSTRWPGGDIRVAVALRTAGIPTAAMERSFRIR